MKCITTSTVGDVGSCVCVHAGDFLRVEPQSESTQPKALSLAIRLKKMSAVRPSLRKEKTKQNRERRECK